MERSTKEVMIADKHKIVMYDYITGREAQEIALFAQTGADGQLTQQVQIEANNFAFKKAIVSFDGITEPAKILDAILDLPIAEFAEVSELVKALIDPKKK